MNEKAIKAMGDFLTALGIDWQTNGMAKTPERVAEMYEYLFNGVKVDTKDVWKETFATETNGVVAVKNIPFYSMCEHHLVPFFGEVNIAYLPHDGKVAGFSKFAKLVEIISHRPQLQERMTREIAEAVKEDLAADGVLVIVKAQQMCMTMRGDMAHGTETITSECNGTMKSNHEIYEQAWLLMGEKK